MATTTTMPEEKFNTNMAFDRTSPIAMVEGLLRWLSSISGADAVLLFMDWPSNDGMTGVRVNLFRDEDTWTLTQAPIQWLPLEQYLRQTVHLPYNGTFQSLNPLKAYLPNDWTPTPDSRIYILGINNGDVLCAVVILAGDNLSPFSQLQVTFPQVEQQIAQLIHIAWKLHESTRERDAAMLIGDAQRRVFQATDVEAIMHIIVDTVWQLLDAQHIAYVRQKDMIDHCVILSERGKGYIPYPQLLDALSSGETRHNDLWFDTAPDTQNTYTLSHGQTSKIGFTDTVFVTLPATDHRWTIKYELLRRVVDDLFVAVEWFTTQGQRLDSLNSLQAIVDAADDGILLLDHEGELLQANYSAERLLDMPLDEFLGTNFAETLLKRIRDNTMSSDAYEGLRRMARILRTEPQRITRRQFSLIHPENTVHIEEIGSPVHDNQSRIVGRLLVLRDITEQKQLESYRDEITHMAIHDLRGPLGAVISGLILTQDILDEALSDDVKDIINQTMGVALDSANNLLNLVDSLMDIAKLETRTLPLNIEDIDVAVLLDESVKTLRPSLMAAEIDLKIIVEPEIPVIQADREKVQRVVTNLLDNAIRYAPLSGAIIIQASSLQRLVKISVNDSGSGIPGDQQRRIFEKFLRIPGQIPHRGSKGSGLGLTFCKLVVEAHEGRIWVDNNGVLSGANFQFTLPIQQDA